MSNPWYLYIVECRDGSLYTGITTDIIRRIKQHNSGKGAKYTRSRNPVKLVFKESHKNRSSASKSEFRIKQLSRREKLTLINEGYENE